MPLCPNTVSVSDAVSARMSPVSAATRSSSERAESRSSVSGRKSAPRMSSAPKPASLGLFGRA